MSSEHWSTDVHKNCTYNAKFLKHLHPDYAQHTRVKTNLGIQWGLSLGEDAMEDD
jgi:hypothetical protein